MKIAVIGSGFGGLTAALLLAHKGHEVHVYEKEGTSGGKAGELQLGKYRFDTGPSLLTMPHVFEDIFKQVGKNFSEYVPYKELEVLCKYWFADGLELSTYSDKEKLFDELTSKTDVTKKDLERYFAHTKKIYDFTSPAFMYKPFMDAKKFDPASIKILFNLGKLDPFRSMHKANTKFFSDPHLVQLFDRYATYVGSNPFVCPATLNIVSQVEYKYGGYYPLHGIYSIITGVLKACKEEGVQIHLNAPVQKLLLENQSVTGLQVKGKKHTFDRVVAGVDVTSLYSDLVKEETPMRKKYAQLEPSSSALVFYWGVKGKYPQLDAHNIFFTADYKEEFDALFNRKTICDDPTVYISISSKYNHKDAPKDGENWFVMVNAPHIDGQDWDKLVQKQRTVIKEKLEGILGPIEIVEESILTPENIMHNTAANKGGIYGTSSNAKMAAYLRHKNISPLTNLYCCGGSTHPGGGMTMSALSGTFVARLLK